MSVIEVSDDNEGRDNNLEILEEDRAASTAKEAIIDLTFTPGKKASSQGKKRTNSIAGMRKNHSQRYEERMANSKGGFHFE